jgi:3-deoxy-D-manno-octulosonate 8-phosphate phosphatase (KDO 8-P phosphatase)
MHNDSALQFAQREHFTAIYMEFKHKKEVFERICQEQQLQPHQVAFVFDDVLDLSVAELCGIRIMIGRKASPLLIEYVRDNKLADYITHHTGGEHGVREASELMLGLTNQYRTACEGRIRFEGPYAEYFALRNAQQTQLITPDKA